MPWKNKSKNNLTSGHLVRASGTEKIQKIKIKVRGNLLGTQVTQYGLGKGRVFSHIFLDAVMSCQILRIPDSGPALFTSPNKSCSILLQISAILN